MVFHYPAIFSWVKRSFSRKRKLSKLLSTALKSWKENNGKGSLYQGTLREHLSLTVASNHWPWLCKSTLFPVTKIIFQWRSLKCLTGAMRGSRYLVSYVNFVAKHSWQRSIKPSGIGIKQSRSSLEFTWLIHVTKLRPVRVHCDTVESYNSKASETFWDYNLFFK